MNRLFWMSLSPLNIKLNNAAACDERRQHFLFKLLFKGSIRIYELVLVLKYFVKEIYVRSMGRCSELETFRLKLWDRYTTVREFYGGIDISFEDFGLSSCRNISFLKSH